jgi:hypothetical protein
VLLAPCGATASHRERSIIRYACLAKLVEYLTSHSGGSFTKQGRQISGVASCELKSTHEPSLAPKATLRIDGHTCYCKLSSHNHSRCCIVRPHCTRLDQSACIEFRFRTFWSLTSRGLPVRLHQICRLWQESQRLKPIDLWTRSARCFTPNPYLDLLTQACGDEPSSDQRRHMR